MADLKAPKFQAALDRLRKKIAEPAVLRVGWFPEDKYDDGTLLSFVAAMQEFGTGKIPPRPFFRPMIAEKQSSWANYVIATLKHNQWDAQKTLESLGIAIVYQLQQSIVSVLNPPLSPITLMLRYMKHKDPTLIVTGATVGEAARRVDAGEVPTGISTKPLEDTKRMFQGVRSSVDKS